MSSWLSLRSVRADAMAEGAEKTLVACRKLRLANNRRDHHEIALFEVGSEAEGLRPRQIGLSHIAFRLRNEEELRAAYKEFKEKHVPISFTVDHGITKSIYFRDPTDTNSRCTATVHPRKLPNSPTPTWG